VTSVGSRGDSYDNALAETIIGLYKTELVRRRGPWKGLDDVEYATLEWVDWFNHRRLLEPIGDVPPAEFEAAYRRREDPSNTVGLTEPSLGKPGPVHSGKPGPGSEPIMGLHFCPSFAQVRRRTVFSEDLRAHVASGYASADPETHDS
jgi:hypothetical protein